MHQLNSNHQQEANVKMGFLFTGLFWGSILVLLGLSVILKAVFHINIPVFRIAFGLVIIYMGIRVLTGGHFGRVSDNTVLFEESRVEMSAISDEYNVLFGKGVIDATNRPEDRKVRKVEVNTIFGHSTIKISTGVPTIVKVSSAFGGCRLPDGTMVSFGEYTYRNKAAQQSEAVTIIKSSVVFGGSDVVLVEEAQSEEEKEAEEVGTETVAPQGTSPSEPES